MNIYRFGFFISVSEKFSLGPQTVEIRNWFWFLENNLYIIYEYILLYDELIRKKRTKINDTKLKSEHFKITNESTNYLKCMTFQIKNSIKINIQIEIENKME